MADLSEDRRKQLDGIVQKMVANQESDDTIKTVVGDFKSKYAMQDKGFLPALWENINPMNLYQAGKAAGTVLFGPDEAAHQAARDLWAGNEAEAQKARESFKQGKPILGTIQAAASGIPLLGPAIAQPMEEVAAGQYGAAAGHATGLALPGLVGKGITATAKATTKLAPSMYEVALRPGSKASLAQRRAMIARGLKPGEELPISESSIPKLEAEITRNKATIDTLTKTDPVYSTRTVPIDVVLSPIDDWITKVRPASVQMAKQLSKAKEQWSRTLGYPGKTSATIAEVQKLKESLYAITSQSAYAEMADVSGAVKGRKVAASGLKEAIESAIPEEPIKAINRAIENDIRLKQAITKTVKVHPSWINDWAVFVLGTGAGEMFAGHVGGAAAAIGALTRMAARNPHIMSRLAIALNKTGTKVSAAGKVATATGVATGLLSPRGIGEKPSLEVPPAETSQASDPYALVDTAAALHEVDPKLAHAVALAESNYDQAKVSPKGAKGIMQLMDDKARELKVNADNPTQNVEGGVRYLKQLLEKYKGNVPLALAAYNAGEGAVAQYGGIPPFPETQDYIRRVMAAFQPGLPPPPQ